MKMMHGATWRARANRRAICCSRFAIPFAQQVGRFGGDEIRLRLARDGLGEQGLAGAGRAIEQEALGRADAEAAERVGILQRQLDAFLQPRLRLVEPADIVPADARRLDHHLAHRRWLDALQRIEEILARDASVSSTSGGMVRSSRLSRGMILRTASIAASRASAARSAPTKP